VQGSNAREEAFSKKDGGKSVDEDCLPKQKKDHVVARVKK